MENINTKSILAKLMATENLHIEQRNVQTAKFDIQNRILTVPILDEKISPELYDLFMGHEVGHALFTPLDKLKEVVEKKYNKSIVNIIEDARIERKIKSKYPGLRYSFFRGYKELMERDFFGVADKNVSEMNFIDRINLYFKVGADLRIEFTPEEKQILKEIEETQSFDDVLVVYDKIAERLREENQETPDESGDSFDYGSDFNDFDDYDEEIAPEYDDTQESGDDDTGNSEETDGADEQNSTGGAGSSVKSEKPEEAGKAETQNGASGGSESNDDEFRSLTDEEYRKNESRLFSEKSKQYFYGNVPTFDMSKGIINYKKIWSEYESWLKKNFTFYQPEVIKQRNDDAAEKFLEFRNSTKNMVGYLVKEFELRKNAEQMKRVSIAKTGDLNLNKVFSYNFSEDIFKKAAIVPNGKSHGLVMFIDWSGSMSDHLGETIRQLLTLVMFCKKVNIPYDVYAFSSRQNPFTNVGTNFSHNLGEMGTNNMCLLNILSSQMTATEFSYASGVLLLGGNNTWYLPDWMCLDGTPLNESVVAAMEIVPAFRKKYRLQVVNTVFLTDGEGHANMQIYGSPSPNTWSHSTGQSQNKQVLVIRDPVTRVEERVGRLDAQNLTAAYIKLLKARTNCNIVGFYVLSAREAKYCISKFVSEKDELRRASILEKLHAEFRTNKNCTVTSAGYDEYYLMRSNAIDSSEEEFSVKEGASFRVLATAFSKHNRNRRGSRIILNRFVNMIA
jgi:hypothetical protein